MYLTELGLYQHETGQSEFNVLFIVGGRVGDKTDNSIAWSTVFALSVQFMARTQLFYEVSHNRCVTLELNCSSKKWNTLLIRLMQEFKKAYEEKTFLRWMTLFFFSNIFVVWQGGYNLVWTYICELQVFILAELIAQ